MVAPTKHAGVSAAATAKLFFGPPPSTPSQVSALSEDEAALCRSTGGSGRPKTVQHRKDVISTKKDKSAKAEIKEKKIKMGSESKVAAINSGARGRGMSVFGGSPLKMLSPFSSPQLQSDSPVKMSPLNKARETVKSLVQVFSPKSAKKAPVNDIMPMDS